MRRDWSELTRAGATPQSAPFTDEASRLLASVRRAADRAGKAVTSELVLLFLYRNAAAIARVLDASGFDDARFAASFRVRAACSPSGDASVWRADANEVLDAALQASKLERRGQIAPRHLLMGILSSPGTGASELLLTAGCDTRRIVAALEKRSLRAASSRPAPSVALAGEGTEVEEAQSTVGSPSTAYLQEGLQLGEYELVASIAIPTAPGKAHVWRALHGPTGADRVLKLYPLDEETPQRRARWETEARIGKRWSRYKEVVTTYFAGELGRFFVIALRPMGPTLEEYLEERSRGQQPWEEPAKYAQWLLAVGSALRLIHQAGDLHRDVTSRNLLLEQDNSAVRLSDFSIGVDPETLRSTSHGEFVGTRGEVAPEHYRNEHSPAADQYQLSYVAWQLFAGDPYPLDADGRLRRQPALRAPLERALSPDPRRRYPDTMSFVAELEQATRNAGRPSAYLRYGPPVLRRLAIRCLQVLGCFAILTAWSGRTFHTSGNTASGLAALVLGLVVLLFATGVEALYFRNTSPNSSQGHRWVTARTSLPFLVGVPLGIALSELFRNRGVPDFLLWLLPALITALAVVLQVLIGLPPSRREGRLVIAFLEALFGARGVVGRLLTGLTVLLVVAGAMAGAVAYITAK